MAAASRAVADRISLVDFVLEIIDARRNESLNKTDLADRSQTELLNSLQARVRELKKSGHSSHATTMMLVGIPNVANSLHQFGRISAAEKGKLKHAMVSPQPGKAKKYQQLEGMSKLPYYLGVTDSVVEIASHPNIYVLDAPGTLPPKIFNLFQA